MRTTAPLTALAVLAMGFTFTSTPAFAQAPPPAETNCTDGADDDADTLIDCADSDCAGKGSCPPPPATTVPAPAPAPGGAPASPPSPPAPIAGPAAPATAAKTSKQTFAERWGATINATTGVISCSVPATNSHGAGQVCWSPGFESGKPWDWTAAPMRWSQSWGEYVSKGTFTSINRANEVVGMRKRLDDMEASLADKASTADVKAARDDLALARAALDAAVANVNTSLEPVNGRISGVEGQVTSILLRLDKVESDVSDLKERVTAVEESDAKQDEALAYLLRNSRVYFDVVAGVLVLRGERIAIDLDEDGEDDFFFREAESKLFSVGGTIGLVHNESGHGLQLTGTIAWGEDSDGTGVNLSLIVGPMFRLVDGVAMGLRAGLNVSRHGLVDGVDTASATGGTVAYSMMATGPIDFLPRLRLDVGATVEGVRYDDLTGSHRPVAARVFVQFTGGWGGSVKASPVSASDFETE